MNCPQCSNQMVLARATSFGPEYDYCRTCKKELGEMNPCAGIDVSGTQPSRYPPRSPSRSTPPDVYAAIKTLRTLSHLTKEHEDGKTIYVKDTSCSEQCRSIGVVPVHFFHRPKPAPYAANTSCECHAYKRPGVENRPHPGPGMPMDDDG